jgi:hypothetical protein
MRTARFVIALVASILLTFAAIGTAASANPGMTYDSVNFPGMTYD